MRNSLLLLLIFIATQSTAQNKKPVPVLTFGVDYRQNPIDIEDASSGPLTPIARSTFGELTDYNFWRVFSINAGLGIETKKKWCFSLESYTRYNHNNYLKDPSIRTGPTTGYLDNNTLDKENKTTKETRKIPDNISRPRVY